MRARIHVVLPGTPNTYNSFVVKGRSREVLESKVKEKSVEIMKKGWKIWLVSWDYSV